MRRTAVSALVVSGLVALGAATAVTRGGAPVAALAASPAPCASLAPTDADLSEGPTKAFDAARNIRSRGTLRAAVIFVDFSDAPGSEAPAKILSDWIRPGIGWLRGSSYRRFTILPQAASAWVRMPRPAASYSYASSHETHKQYIADAIAAADPTFDFSRTDIVYVVAAKTNPGVISDSPTFRAVSGELAADGRQLGPAVTFGFDAYSYGRTIVPHETGHLLGLPDLYADSGTNTHRFVGSWDVMGNVFDATDLTAWHRLKLGWLDAHQVVCAPRRGKRTVVLTPLGARGGIKAVFVRTGRTTGLLVENRQPVANDSAICDRGALVYTVDSAIGSGGGPIKVVGGAGDCGHGPRSDAPLQLGQSVIVGGVRVTVVGSHGSNIRVQVASR